MVQKPIEREDKYSLKKRFSLNKSAKPGRSSDFRESIGLIPRKTLDVAAELSLHLMLRMVEFVRGEDCARARFAKGWASCPIRRVESVAKVSNERPR
jgi:hypothetical protein